MLHVLHICEETHLSAQSQLLNAVFLCLFFPFKTQTTIIWKGHCLAEGAKTGWRRSHNWQKAASLLSRARQAACFQASRPAASTPPPAAWSSARRSRAAPCLWSIATLCGFSRHVQSRMCVRVGRASSTWSVRRQEPPATGAQCAPAAGSFMSWAGRWCVYVRIRGSFEACLPGGGSRGVSVLITSKRRIIM